jgi:hypothetical protein
MRVPIPKAPEMTTTGIAWAFALGFALFFAIFALGLIWQPLSIILAGLIGLVVVWLVGGEMLNDWLDSR